MSPPFWALADPNLLNVQFTSAVSTLPNEITPSVCGCCLKQVLTQTPLYRKVFDHKVLQLLLDRWFEYSECPGLKGTHLLQIAAMYADIETIQILKSTDHFALHYDRSYIAADFATLLHKRWDANENLVTAFEELVRLIDRQPPDGEVDRLASSTRSDERTLNERVDHLNLMESDLLECTHGSSEDATLASDVHDKDDDSSEQSFDDAPDKP
ncbi:MAG: hypothetical protein Q9198_007092 [Flavoplaca austrocitrina]